MKKRFFALFTVILSLGMLSACSGKPTSTDKTAASGSASQSETAASKDTDTTWPRTITDAGEHKITLEKQPERIAILHSNYLEYFFALGVPPIASAGASVGTAQQALDSYETLKSYSGTAEIMDLGSAREINLEAVLEAQPDVIVTFSGHGGLDEIYDQLNEIAPVVLLDFNDTWQQQTLDCAEIIGKEKTAKKLIKQTEEAIAEAHKVLSTQDKTVALFRTNGGKAFVGRGNENYYTAFGIKAPEGYTFDYATFSLESVAAMNPDYIIFQDYTKISEGFVKSQEASSVWMNLTAVQNNHVVFFDDSLNTFGPLAMRLTAEQLVQMIQK